MMPFCGVFLDKDGNGQDLLALAPGGGSGGGEGGEKPDDALLTSETVLDGVFGSGVFTAAQTSMAGFKKDHNTKPSIN